MRTSTVEEDPKILMQRAKRGDREAFGQLFELYFVPIFRYIYFRVKNKEEADDLIQIVFLKIYRSITYFQEKGKVPLAYFFTVARNSVIDYWRKKKDLSLENLDEMPLSAENPHELIERHEMQAMVREAIKKLTQEQQEVINLRFLKELPNREVARILHKSEAAVRQLQSRALKAMRHNLQYTKK